MAKLKQFPGEIKSSEVDIDGSTWTFETGLIAKLSHGSVVLRAGDAVVMANVTYGEAIEGTDFFPLTVDYVERLYSAGIISSSRFIKRESRPRENEVLVARMIDRALRPQFPDGFRLQVQIVVNVLSHDPAFDPGVLGINAASAALAISGLPFEGPIGAIRVGMTDGELGIYMNTMNHEWADNDTDLDLVFAAHKEGIVMFDAGANIVPEEKIVEGMRYGIDYTSKLIDAQVELAKKVDIAPVEYELMLPDEELVKKIKDGYGKEIEESVLRGERGDESTSQAEILEKIFEEFEGDYTKSAMKEVVGILRKKAVKSIIIGSGERIDGRKLDEIRPIDVQVGLLPRTHGSALFTRGDTQALSVTTLASTRQEQTVESIEGEEQRRYMHHYNMPPYATGEAGRFMISPNRRETGHGALAEKALMPVLPSKEDFPYTIRVVSEITQSNGSSSMASTCGSSLSLMNAGVPLKASVGGIAMGLVYDEEKDEYHVLSDILGMEDFGGDMDFKVTGTREGVTAIQLDNKRKYIEIDILEEAIKQAQAGRMAIMDEMDKVISAPNESMSEFAPKIDIVKIDPKKIGELIGPGGKNIKAIQESTGAELNIDDDGTVSISSDNEEARQKALQMVQNATMEIEVGQVYDGKVEKVVEFGAFVALPGKNSGLVHVSELSDSFVKDVNDFVKEGQDVRVKVKSKDRDGKISLTMKGVDDKKVPHKAAPKKSKSKSVDDEFVGEPGE